MAATLTSILVHVVYSTKHREPTIPVDLLPDLFAYSGGICRDLRSPLLHAGGVADHVHLLISLGKTIAICDLMQETKRATSSWMKNRRPGLHSFAWQDGYFATSVGHSSLPSVRAYLDAQAEHHAQCDFKTEILTMLKQYEIPYDPDHLWD